MSKIIQSIISNMLIALYQPFWFALLLSVLFMFVWKNNNSIKSAAVQWSEWFKKDKSFRQMFYLVFYTVMILFKTLLNRSMWANPVSDVIGVWGLYKFDASKNEMVMTTEVPENLALFIPFTILLFWIYHGKLLGERFNLGTIIWKSAKVTFLFSLSIEMLQLFLRLGTWQLSDIFYNTLGGVIGGCVFFLVYKTK